MRKQIFKIFLFTLFLPILGVILINEYSRLTINDPGFKTQGVTAINSAQNQKDQCTWICHNNTNYCKQNHVKLAQPYFKQIDLIYFGIIDSLKSTGNYGLANVVFLVILIPLLLVFLLVKILLMQSKIRLLKNQ